MFHVLVLLALKGARQNQPNEERTAALGIGKNETQSPKGAEPFGQGCA